MEWLKAECIMSIHGIIHLNITALGTVWHAQEPFMPKRNKAGDWHSISRLLMKRHHHAHARPDGQGSMPHLQRTHAT